MKKGKTLTFLCIGLLAGALTVAVAQDEGDTEDMDMFELRPQTVCPVEGNAINKEYYVDVYGKRIYVCCDECREKVAADTDNYLDRIEGEGIDLEDAPFEDEAM